MAIEKIGDLGLAEYLKIVSKGAVYNNLSEDTAMWDLVKRYKKGDADGREMRFNLRAAYGVAAVGFVPASGGAFLAAQDSVMNEGTCQYKDFALTVEVEKSLVAKAKADFGRYGEPLAEELRCKTIALSRILSADAYQNGQGLLGEVSGTPSIDANGRLLVTIKTGDTDPGHIGWFEYQDRVIVSATADRARAVGQRDVDTSEGTTTSMVVYSIDRDNNQVTLEARTSADAMVTLAANDNVAATDTIRRYNRTLDVTVASGTDYGTISEGFVGLESLTEDDGRKVNGITLSGALAGSRYSAGGNPIDASHFQSMMSKLMNNVGQGRYKYDRSMMAWETLDALIASRETDRRFDSIKDGTRGVEAMGYRHGRNGLIFEADEFCPKKRIHTIPNGDVLQFHGSDFKQVEPNGGDPWHLKTTTSGAGYSRNIQSFMEGQGVLLCNHAAACGTIHNFTV